VSYGVFRRWPRPRIRLQHPIATLTRGKVTVVLASGSFTLTGRALNFTVKRRVTLESGSFVLTGQDLTLQVCSFKWLEFDGDVAPAWTPEGAAIPMWTGQSAPAIVYSTPSTPTNVWVKEGEETDVWADDALEICEIVGE
jgi:hypothetical protein